ncbi:ABC transporter permease [Leekyejoonella antrihumi]|uniref:ABC transporter permease n=1 Tax=Leekyejoonella antrihumi TaxID=1660198 RepID=A0A563DWF8_9MICO|nr:ABC transporter permease [Leekyejoonella antrihumi]TWP34044.1 ABC transporter permease [Leekyejoonella antrihumi]
MTTTAPQIRARNVPPMGGFNPTLLRLEVRRLLRNKRTMIFTILMPIFFYLVFGLTISSKDQALSAGAHGNVSAFILVSMALYGAILATTSGGSMVSIERSEGWSRQLRLTPLTSLAYVLVKALTAMTLGLAAMLGVFVVGAITGKADMPLWVWVSTAACVWVGSLMYAAYGLFMGYLLPTENVMQILAFSIVLFAFAGGLFVDLSAMPGWYQTFAEFTPLWGLNEIVHGPLLGEFRISWLINAVVWLAIFVGGAVWRFQRDTDRV